MDKFDKKIEEYAEHFKESFPLMLCRTMEEDEIIKIIQKSLDDDEPYEPKLDINADY